MGIILNNRYAKERGIPSVQVGWYHDEFQEEVREDYVEEKKYVAEQAVRDSGTFYDLSCPMTGKAVEGHTWAETH
jgi:hypothetical protein